MTLPWRTTLKWIAGPASRPSWLLDLKWLVGFFCVIAILAAGALYSAAELTERDPATGTFAAVMGALAKEGEGGENFDDVQKMAAEHPDRDVTIEGVTLPVKGREIEGLTYDETVDLVFARLADILYTEGPEAAERYLVDTTGEGAEADGEAEEEDIEPLSLLTRDRHDTIRGVFPYALIPALILLLALTLLSTRFGRLGAPGLALALGSGPLAAAWLAAEGATADPGSDGLEASLASALGPTTASVSGDFARLFFIGVALVAVAVAGQLTFTCCRVSLNVLRRARDKRAPAQAVAGGAGEGAGPPEFLTLTGSAEDPGSEDVPSADVEPSRRR